MSIPVSHIHIIFILLESKLFEILYIREQSDNKDKGKIMKVQETQSFYKADPREAVL